jgi:hypothetical protein
LLCTFCDFRYRSVRLTPATGFNSRSTRFGIRFLGSFFDGDGSIYMGVRELAKLRVRFSLINNSSGPFSLCQSCGHLGVSTSIHAIFNAFLFCSCFSVSCACVLRRPCFPLLRVASPGYGALRETWTDKDQSGGAIYRFSFFGRCAKIPLAALWFAFASSLLSLRFLPSLRFPVLLLSIRTENPTKSYSFRSS